VILVGRYQSPFVRRVAIALKLAGLAYEHNPLSTASDMEAIRKINPLGRVPALVLDDGEVVVDSMAILDHIEQTAGLERALLPPSGRPRREAQKASALALGVMEKGVAAIYERTKRPKELVHAPWRAQLDAQGADGLAALEAQLGDRTWFGGAKPNQADATAIAAFGFVSTVLPRVVPAGTYPRLEALMRLAEAHPAFAETRQQA
jgi:glutathione S-transferase